MKIIKFPEQNITLGENQEEYLPLPAYRFIDGSGRIVFCWKLNLIEKIKVLFTGKIWHQVLTFNSPLQPQMMSVERPEIK